MTQGCHILFICPPVQTGAIFSHRDCAWDSSTEHRGVSVKHLSATALSFHSTKWWEGAQGRGGWLESVTVQIPLAKGQKEGEYYLPGSEQMDLFPEGKIYIYIFSAILNIPPQNSGFLHRKHFQMQNEHAVCDHQQLDNNMSSPDPGTGKERKRANCLKLRPFVGIFFKAREFWERILK